MEHTRPTEWAVTLELRRQGIPAAAALAYGVMWGWADRQPGHIIVVSRALGATLGCDRRAADKWIDTLAAAGLVAVVSRDAGGRRNVYIYRPCVGAGADSPPPPVDRQMRLPLEAGDPTAEGAPLRRADGAPPAEGAPSGRADGAPPPAADKGEPGGVSTRATIFSLSLSLDDVDDSERSIEEITQRAHETLQRIREVLSIRKVNGQEWDDLCVAAVLSVTRLSREWLGIAVNQTAAAVRRRRHSDQPITDPVRYLKGCLRNGLAETLGVCSKDEKFDAYGKLYRWSRPAVARLKQYAEQRRQAR